MILTMDGSGGGGGGQTAVGAVAVAVVGAVDDNWRQKQPETRESMVT